MKVNGDYGFKANKKNIISVFSRTQIYQKKALYRETSHLKNFYGDILSFLELDSHCSSLNCVTCQV